MKPENLTALSNEELLKKLKNLKTDKLINATIIGVTIGIVVYSAVKNGFGFFTFFTLVAAILIARSFASNTILEKEVQKEIASRNLQ
ncbi:hypothetical protein [Chryseobacterium paludis]|uniref:hypothetical protein n=1 Tax=Chryseobacterium paludis TaxID=2956784 RepID=UPI0021BFDEE6|nr:hypothetical protein [Chryseobacterium paludis]